MSLKSKFPIIGVMVMAMLVSGCNGARETDQVAYILALGLDKSAIEGKVLVTYQIAIPRSLGEAGSKIGEQTSVNVSIEAANLAEARNLLNTRMARLPNLSHIKAIIIGDELAKKGLVEVVGPIVRFREFRETMYILVVKDDSAYNLLNKLKPRLEFLPTRYIETMMLTARESGYFRPTQIHDFYQRMKTGCMSPYAALVGLNSFDRYQPSAQKSPREKVDEYLPGGVPRKGVGNPAEFLGTAVFQGNKLVGYLTNEETRILSILQGDFQNAYLVVQDPLKPDKAVNLNARIGSPPKIKARLANGKLSFDVSVLIEGEVTAIPSGINYESEQNRKILEHAFAQLLQDQANSFIEKTKTWGADVVGFNYYARPFFPTYDDFMKADWRQLYRNADYKVNISVKIRRTALMWRTTPVRQLK